MIEGGGSDPTVPSPAKRERAKGEGPESAMQAGRERSVAAAAGEAAPGRPADPSPFALSPLRGARDLGEGRRRLSIGRGGERLERDSGRCLALARLSIRSKGRSTVEGLPQ